MDDQHRLEALSAAFRALPGLAILVLGDDQRVAAVSDAWADSAGGRRLDSRLREWDDLVGQQLVERFEEVYRTGEPFVARDWTVEFVGPGGEPKAAVFDFSVVPVRESDGRAVGALGVGRDVSDRGRARERTSGLERRASAGHGAVAQLQDVVLPKGLPVPQGVELAARYLLAESDGVAGGDWFDAIPLPAGGQVVAIVGDVAGHGIEAAVVMGELKALFDEEVRTRGDVVAALSLLDARAARLRAARAATIGACVLDPVSGELSYCTAGHPPPIVVTADGHASYLPTTGAGPLGSGLPFRTGRHTLGPGDLLLLYSDGIVERPGRTPAQSTVELLQVVRDTARGVGPVTVASSELVVERVCRQTLELLTRVTGYTDDITLLALRVVPPVEPLELRVPAVPDAVRDLRAQLEEWLDALRVSVVDSTAVLHAAGELVSNAVEHAYSWVDSRNTVTMTVVLRPDGILDLTVADEGAWRTAETSDQRGHGLGLVRRFVDEFELEHDGTGTRARIRHRLSRPVTMLRGVRRTPPEPPTRSFRLTADGDRIVVAGVVDRAAAIRLERVLARTSRGGTRPVEVDLSEVSLLTSAAVQVLAEARATSEVALIAVAGCPAQHVLELVGLPYDGDP